VTGPEPAAVATPLPRDADVVVVGGGIVGCATAYYLARRGVRAVVIERGTAHGEQSRKNWGFVRQQGRDPAEVPLVMEANRIWCGIERELGADVEWTQGGNVALALTPERLALLEEWQAGARAFGLDTRMVRPQDLQAIVPGLAGDWIGGMYTPGDGHADPPKATDAFARAATAHGASIHLGAAVRGIEARDGRVRAVVTDRGEIRTAWAVCAAGAWSWRLARAVGLALPQRWVRGTVARTTVAPPVSPCAVGGRASPFGSAGTAASTSPPAEPSTTTSRSTRSARSASSSRTSGGTRRCSASTSAGRWRGAWARCCPARRHAAIR
jgi:glycine/D-amino acid oxidase-like deaminating enzyme